MASSWISEPLPGYSDQGAASRFSSTGSTSFSTRASAPTSGAWSGASCEFVAQDPAPGGATSYGVGPERCARCRTAAACNLDQAFFSRATFLFWFENKRILNEARRRNQFVDIAEKRWVISKIIYISIILFSLIVSFLLIQGDLNFLEKSIITSNGQVIYGSR